MANSVLDDFNEIRIDAIGEIQNITMGSAATAVSNLLNAKVWITTPEVSVCKASELSYPDLEPSVYVRIKYIQGITGSSLLVLKQSDVQLILAQLMGMPLVVSDDFVFDEISTSAICEVMNQMMGASATALSKLIDTVIDISTPEAIISENQQNFVELQGIDKDDYVCSVSFQLTIDGVINSKFITLLSIELAKDMSDKMLKGYSDALESYTAETDIDTNLPESSIPVPEPEIVIPQPEPVEEIPQPIPTAPPPIQQAEPTPPPPVNNVQTVQSMQVHADDDSKFTRDQLDNLKLLMNVPLELSIEIGSAQKKVEDILEFSQGTVIELDSQASAPVDVIVNGQLIAKGDVVVVYDNFAIKITEIVKSNLLDTLGNKE